MKRPSKKELEEIHGKLLTWPAVGWSVDPRKIDVSDAALVVETLAAAAHVTWRCKVREGAMADEDVSPGEGLMLIASLIRHLGKAAHARKVDAKVLTDKYGRTRLGHVDQLCRDMCRDLDKIAPGYLGGSNGH
jgi:hypothetical protein